MQVEGKTWVVTGGASGIGRELVLQLLQRDCRVAAIDVKESDLRETARLAHAGDRLTTHVVDITDQRAVKSLVNEVEAAHGPVDGLVNNAGIIQPFVPFADLAEADIRHVLDVNLMGTIHMLKAFLPALQRRPEACVVNVSSMGGYFPFPNQTLYGASKAAVKLLSEGLYAELEGTGIGVSVVMPGPTNTAIAVGVPGVPEQPADSRMPVMEADEAARLIIRGIERDQLHVYLGTMARVANFAIRVAPRRAILFVRKQMQNLMADQEATSAD